MLGEIISCSLSRWSPGLGDPHFMGWVTVAVYLIAAAAALRRAARGPFPVATRRRERWFWAFTGVALLFLAVNKQLDLQSFVTEIGRCLAQAQGWYEERRVVQRWFVLGILVAGFLAVVTVAFALRATLRRTALPILGLGFVSIFVVVRAAGFHHIDELISTEVARLQTNWLLELPGPFLVFVGAMRGSTPS